MPYAPQQPGIGFGVPLNGQVDKFISTNQLDLSGTTITANIDYTITKDPTRTKGLRVLMGPFSIYDKSNVEASAK